jgi:hypothetical protein
VTAVRFFVEDTFEEVGTTTHRAKYTQPRATIRKMANNHPQQRILHLQQSKKKLEEILLDPREGGEQQSEPLAGLEVC